MADTPLLTRERALLLGQFFRYAITGVVTSLVNIVIYHLCATAGRLDPNLAWTIGFVIAARTALHFGLKRYSAYGG